MLKQQFPFQYFHAHGVGFGAEITKPFSATVDSQAATAISSVGGHAVSTVEGFNYRELIRIGRMSTQIAAIAEDVDEVDEKGAVRRARSYDTVVTCRLEGVNIFNQFTADVIVGHLSVKTDTKGRIIHFNTVGSRFEHLRVGGVPLHPECDSEYTGGLPPKRIANPLFDFSAKDKEGRGTEMKPDVENKNGYLTTLVSGLKSDSNLVQVKNNAIFVADFGVVYLAEYLVTPNARQLSMFRIQFGCGVDGRSSGGGVGGNGSSCPPPP